MNLEAETSNDTQGTGVVGVGCENISRCRAHKVEKTHLNHLCLYEKFNRADG